MNNIFIKINILEYEYLIFSAFFTTSSIVFLYDIKRGIPLNTKKDLFN